MSYAMIWIESLTAALLLVATVAACVARWPQRWARLTVLFVVTLPLFALAATVSIGTGFLKYDFPVTDETNWFCCSLLWALGFTAGAAILSVRGAGRAGEPPAAAWPRGALALGFAATTVLLYMTYANLELARKLQQASLRAEAGAKLLALSPPRLPDADNAALIYQQAFDNLTPLNNLPPAWKIKADDWFSDTQMPRDPKDKDLLDYLASQDRALTLLRKAAAMPNCAFDPGYCLTNFSMPVSELDQFLKQLHRSAKLLSLHALARAGAGDFGAALDDVAALLGVAQHTKQPSLVLVMNALSSEKLAIHTLEEVMALGPVPAEQLATLPLTEPASDRRAVARALQMEEEVFGLAVFGMLGDDPEMANALEVGKGWFAELLVSLWRVFLMPDDLAAYRRLMGRMRQLAERPYYEAYPDWQKLDGEIIQSRRERRIVTLLLLPAASGYAVRAAEADAHRRLARLAVAAVLYKAKNGKYPKSMDDLVPAFLPRPLLDPFTGKTLDLRPDGDGLILSSSRTNLPYGETNRTAEIVFRLK